MDKTSFLDPTTSASAADGKVICVNCPDKATQHQAKGSPPGSFEGQRSRGRCLVPGCPCRQFKRAV